MKGAFHKSIYYNELENKRPRSYPLDSPGINSGFKNHFLVLGQEEHFPEQAGTAEASFLGTSFLAAS